MSDLDLMSRLAAMQQSLAVLRARGDADTQAILAQLVDDLNAVTVEIQHTRAMTPRAAECYSALFNNQHSVMLLSDPESGQIVDANPAACAYYGYSRSELTAKCVTDLNTLPPEQVRAELERARQLQQNFFQFQHRLANGEVRDVEVRSGAITLDDRPLLYSIIHDVTDRRRAEEAWHYSEEKYRRLFNSAHVGIFRSSIAEGRIIEANQKLAQMFGYDRPEDMFATFLGITHYVNPTDRVRLLAELKDDGTYITFEVPFTRLNGSRLWTIMEVRKDVAAQCIEGVMLDITAHRLTTDALLDSEVRNRSIVEVLAEGILLQLHTGEVIFANNSAARILGLTREQLVGRDVLDPRGRITTLAGLPMPADAQPAMVALRTGQPVRDQLVGVLRPDGTQVWLSVNAEPMFHADSLEAYAAVMSFIDVTDRVQAEARQSQINEELELRVAERTAALRESEKQLQLILNATRDGFWDWDIPTNDLFVSPRLVEMLGYPVEEFKPGSEFWPQMVHPADWPTVQAATTAHFLGQMPALEIEHRIRNKAGNWWWAHTRGQVVTRDAAGQPVRFVGMMTDISDRKATEIQLRALLDAIPDVMFVNQLDGLYVDYHASDRDLLAMPPEVFLGKHPTEVLPPDLATLAMTQFNRVVQTGGPLTYTYPLALGGEIRQFEARLVKCGPDQVLTIVRDITDRKQAEDALRQSEERYRGLIESQTDLIVRVDPSGAFTYVNDVYCATFGKTRDELLGHTFMPLVHPDDLPATLKAMEDLNVPPYRVRLEQRALAVTGWRWFSWEDYAIHAEHGQLLEIQGVGRDVTERKQAEAALRESEVRYRTLFEAANDAIFIHQVRPDGFPGDILAVNNVACEWLGYTREELLHIPVEMYDTMAYRDEAARAIDQLRTVGDATFERLCVARTGRRFPVEINARQVELNGAQVYMSIMRDITQRKQTEVALQQALQRERELNQLKTQFVSMVSHEFRTPLTAIQSTSDLLQHYGQRFSEEKKQSYLDRIQAAIKRMTTMLDEVLILGRAEAGKLEFNPGPIELEWFCGALIDEFQLTAGDAYTLNLTFEGDCRTAYLDENLLRHILTNLISNAIKYSPDGGPIEFAVACDQQQIVFRVIDHGIGIPPEGLARLFETFYRASNVGSIQGTGLGLAIVKHVVDLHHGTIMFDSALGCGTTFIVKLPVGQA